MIPGAIQIVRETVCELRGCIEAQPLDEDTFLSSVAYFVHTGRKGLWLVRDGELYAIVCHHPNRSNQFLVFPQAGRFEIDYLLDVCRRLPKTTNEVKLCRIHHRYQEQMSLRSEFNLIEEEVLDWRYPCTIVSNV